ncbi:MAG: hypothetical protein IJ225_00105 [Solobacterium sp.]|nr:hypothetical protein [Solobacterium sp.]
MKKLLAFVTAALLLAGCGTSSSESTAPAAAEPAVEETTEAAAEDVQTVGEYTVYNATGESVSELYLYPVGSDKGENLAGERGLSDAHAIGLTYDAGDKASETTLTLEFVTSSGYTAAFETLHIETVPITLLAEDALTGATPIAFQSTTAKYTIYNKTGETVTDLYLYATGSSDKGDNLIAEAAEPDGSQVIELDSVPAANVKDDGTLSPFTLEFTTESGYTGSFTTLSYEVAPIQLVSEDMLTGATQIQFGAPAN